VTGEGGGGRRRTRISTVGVPGSGPLPILSNSCSLLRACLEASEKINWFRQ
jgi:hypothetical protein